VKLSDLAALPLEVGSAIRRRRVFHPMGVLATGTLHRLAEPDADDTAGAGLPLRTADVVVRISKAVGTPGGTPDLTGLAIRLPPERPGDTPWDVLLASTGAGRLGRLLLRPVTSWQAASMTTLMPLSHGGRLYWLRGRLRSALPDQGLSLDAVKRTIADGGLSFDIDQAVGLDDFAPAARLDVTNLVADGTDVAFDPARNIPGGVDLAPAWLTAFRRAAYRRSRAGRDA
jgi:hypothetical protein